MRPFVFSPEHLSPEQRAREVARILATGLLRLVRNATSAAMLAEHAEAKNLPESSEVCLEVVPFPSLTVHNG
jgi:hypothetical protein